ncbi:MAG: hypothetical protein ACI8YB_000781, partial [Patiriisocius sp.]
DPTLGLDQDHSKRQARLALGKLQPTGLCD